MKRAAFTVAVFLLVVLLGWYGGADFTERGFGNATILGYAVFIAGATYFFPGWKK